MLEKWQGVKDLRFVGRGVVKPEWFFDKKMIMDWQRGGESLFDWWDKFQVSCRVNFFKIFFLRSFTTSHLDPTSWSFRYFPRVGCPVGALLGFTAALTELLNCAELWQGRISVLRDFYRFPTPQLFFSSWTQQQTASAVAAVAAAAVTATKKNKKGEKCVFCVCVCVWGSRLVRCAGLALVARHCS